VLENGKSAEEVSYSDFIEKDGKFKGLVEKQIYKNLKTVLPFNQYL